MDKKNMTPPSGDDASWLDDLLVASDYGEDAIRDISGSVEDLELERILREAKSGKWDPVEEPSNEPEPAIVINPAPVQPPRPAFEDPEIAASVNLEDDYEEEPEEDAPEEYEEDEVFVDPDRKVRPKRKGGYGLFAIPHLASVIIWITIVAICGASLGNLLWVCATDVLAFGREDRVTTITISSSDEGNMDAIASKLQSAGLIKYKPLFLLYASISGAEEKISAGTFELNTKFDYNALVKGMSATSSYRESVKVTIPEGYTCAQIFALLEEKGVCSAAELKAYRVQSDYWFLEGSKADAEYPLEGFLFPDTYNFYIGDTPQGVFRRLLARFDEILDDEMKGYLQDSKYSLYEVIIIASMIEKESVGSNDNLYISHVINNRLDKPWEFPYLNIDATIIYGQGGNNDYIDKELDSPYNTYTNKGLPPTPICNPSRMSILATLSPAQPEGKGPCYYYALNPSAGRHEFFENDDDFYNFLNSLK